MDTTRSSSRSAKRYLAIIALVIQLTSVLFLLWQNHALVTISFVSFTITLPIAVAIMIGICLGVGSLTCLYLLLNKSNVNKEKALAWQAQDVKLMASIVSDREKQLEAKIATLESALKTALKKVESS